MADRGTCVMQDQIVTAGQPRIEVDARKGGIVQILPQGIGRGMGNELIPANTAVDPEKLPFSHQFQYRCASGKLFVPAQG